MYKATNQLVSNELLQNNPDVLKSLLESLVAAAAANSTATVGTPAAAPLNAEKPQLAEVSDADKTKTATKRAAEEMVEPTTEATKEVKPTEPTPTPNGSTDSSTAAADTAVPTEKPNTAEPAEPAPVED